MTDEPQKYVHVPAPSKPSQFRLGHWVDYRGKVGIHLGYTGILPRATSIFPWEIQGLEAQSLRYREAQLDNIAEDAEAVRAMREMLSKAIEGCVEVHLVSDWGTTRSIVFCDPRELKPARLEQIPERRRGRMNNDEEYAARLGYAS